MTYLLHLGGMRRYVRRLAKYSSTSVKNPRIKFRSIRCTQNVVRRLIRSVESLFCIEMYQELYQAKNGQKSVKMGRFWAKMTGWVVSGPRKCGISFRKCGISFRKCGMCKNREIVDTPTFSRFRLYMLYLKKKLFSQKTNFTFFADTLYQLYQFVSELSLRI